MKKKLAGLGISLAVLWATPAPGQTEVDARFVVLDEPYVVSSASPEPRFDEDDLPFLWLQERFWKARTWDDMKALYTAESITWLEETGERPFYEDAMKRGWFQGEVAFPAYVAIRSGDDEAILAQMVVGGLDAPESEVFLVRSVRKVGSSWRIDSLLEDSPLAVILATTPAAELATELLSGESEAAEAGCTDEQLRRMKELGLSEEQIRAACGAGS